MCKLPQQPPYGQIERPSLRTAAVRGVQSVYPYIPYPIPYILGDYVVSVGYSGGKPLHLTFRVGIVAASPWLRMQIACFKRQARL